VEDLTGRQFGPYQIVAPLGEGGMAAVYKAYHPAVERYVALKVLPRHMSSSDEFVARFKREARLLAQLQHPHILPVFDYGESDGYPYIVMPFIISGTLADILRKQRLSLSEVCRVIIQIGDALSYAHGRGMIHRDIKPSNVLIDERGNCLLTDFGLARMVEAAEKLTSSGSIMGTPAYMSPEQGRGSNIDHRSDLYSLGVILYEMITGRVPYTAETPVAVVFKHIQDPLPSARKLNPNLSEALELVLLKSLAKNSDDRYQNADEFVHAVQRVIPESAAADKTLSQKLDPIRSTSEETRVAERQPIFEFQAIPVQADAPREEQLTAKVQSARRFPIRAFAGIGAIVLAVVVSVIAMSMLNRPGTPVADPTVAITNTSVPISSSTSLPASLPTSTVQVEIPVGQTFTDPFENRLAEGWTWLAENPSKWSLSAVPGWLQLMVIDASFDGPSLPANLLLRDPPAGDFEATTLVEFNPTSNFQFAGLVVFQEQGNVLQFGRAFCELPDICPGGGIYFDNFENGGITGSSHMIALDNSAVYLRLRRVGNAYTAYYSEDGQNWILLGEHDRDFSQARVGLMAAQSAEEIPALFDFFTISSVSE
jgi:serine/threonine protein kinase